MAWRWVNQHIFIFLLTTPLICSYLPQAKQYFVSFLTIDSSCNSFFTKLIQQALLINTLFPGRLIKSCLSLLPEVVLKQPIRLELARCTRQSLKDCLRLGPMWQHSRWQTKYTPPQLKTDKEKSHTEMTSTSTHQGWSRCKLTWKVVLLN